VAGLPVDSGNATPENNAAPDVAGILSELVSILARGRLLTETEAMRIQRKLATGRRKPAGRREHDIQEPRDEYSGRFER
jgi:hypothetical protein